MYICHKLQNVWHWCRNCPDYPTGNFVINRATPPPKEEMCPRCKELEDNQGCDG